MGSLTNSSCFSPLHRTLFPVYTLIFPPRSFAVEKYSFFFFLTQFGSFDYRNLKWYAVLTEKELEACLG